MKGYAVHLLFHLLAVVAGAGIGVGAALWWTGQQPFALWLAIAALVFGVLLLVLQGLFLARGGQRSRTAPRPAPGPELRRDGTSAVPPEAARMAPVRPSSAPPVRDGGARAPAEDRPAPDGGTRTWTPENEPAHDGGTLRTPGEADDGTRSPAMDRLNREWNERIKRG
ncbi:hypothetical protein [Saccharopolyspora sp. CA-218241]|uniref:hypothetical protein n=1 Tax=Saccharopolyspora sp. CA-218241 TaxID=3240027 RepID=UPI003D962FFA